MEITAWIVQVMKNKHGGRFLTRNKETEAWYELTDAKARDKVSHALRFASKKKTAARMSPPSHGHWEDSEESSTSTGSVASTGQDQDSAGDFEEDSHGLDGRRAYKLRSTSSEKLEDAFDSLWIVEALVSEANAPVDSLRSNDSFFLELVVSAGSEAEHSDTV